MCEQCRQARERDAQFWRVVRRALLMVASAIAKRYPEEQQQERKAA
jgi:hypothetical protein